VSSVETGANGAGQNLYVMYSPGRAYTDTFVLYMFNVYHINFAAHAMFQTPKLQQDKKNQNGKQRTSAYFKLSKPYSRE
jgi:hypothetical protein